VRGGGPSTPLRAACPERRPHRGRSRRARGERTLFAVAIGALALALRVKRMLRGLMR
jgi:hypothetical protein